MPRLDPVNAMISELKVAFTGKNDMPWDIYHSQQQAEKVQERHKTKKNSRQSIIISRRPLPNAISFQNCSKIAIRLAVSGWVLNKEFMNPITPLAKFDG